MTEQTRRASRLLQIERLLRQRPGGMTTAELAAELGYSARTIQRDIAVLESELGAPIVLNGRKYMILPGSHPLAPVRFTLQEARAMLTASRLLFRFADELDPDAMSAFEKLSEALPGHVATQLLATVDLLRTKPHNEQQSAMLRRVTDAWATSHCAAIEYRSSDSAEYRTTTIAPYLIEPAGTGGIYVIGHSERHGEVRTFKLDRIRSVEVLSATFHMDDDRVQELIDALSASWGVFFGGDEQQAVVDFAAPVADRVSETIWHRSQVLTPQPDGGVRLTVSLPDFREFSAWVRSWGAEAVVIEPPDLRASFAEELRMAAARYEGPPA